MKSKFVDPLWFGGGDADGDNEDDDDENDNDKNNGIGRKCAVSMQNSLFYILFR